MELPQQPPGSAHLSYTVGALTAIGGLAAAKRSKRSLAAGLFFGGAFVLAGYYISKGEPERGFRLGTVASGSLAGLMSYRFYKTGKFMPAGTFLSRLLCYKVCFTGRCLNFARSWPSAHVQRFLFTSLCRHAGCRRLGQRYLPRLEVEGVCRRVTLACSAAFCDRLMKLERCYMLDACLVHDD